MGGTLGAAGSAKSKFDDLDTPDEELPDLRKKANSMSMVAIVAGVATGGMVAGAVFVAEF